MNDLPELFARCRASGMRMTSQREAIFRYLQGNTGHPTAEEIYRALRRRHRRLSLATVYNTLETLHRLGEVARYDLGGNAERFDPEIRPHHHFRCSACGRVSDVFVEWPLPEVAALDGYRVDQVQVRLTGECPSCRAAAAPRAEASPARGVHFRPTPKGKGEQPCRS